MDGLDLVKLICKNPDQYVGSVLKESRYLWVYDPNISQMLYREVEYVPGLLKIFDEILINASDEKVRHEEMDRLEVYIDKGKNLISVSNNGVGIPVVKKDGIYIPELLFSDFWFCKDNDRRTGGQFNIGAKLCNIFSIEFTIETADGKNHYKQAFQDNMSVKFSPVISETTEKWTKVTFVPDLEKFNMTQLDDDMVSLMMRRVVDMAGCLLKLPGKTVKVVLNNNVINVDSFQHYTKLYLKNANSIYYNMEGWQISVSRSDSQFQQISFINNVNTIQGGFHVDCITRQIAKFVIDAVKQKEKKADLKEDDVKDLLFLFVDVAVEDPVFDTCHKDTVSSGVAHKLPIDFLKTVTKELGLVKILSRSRRLSCKSKKFHVEAEFHVEAVEAGGTLIVCEGLSALSFVRYAVELFHDRDKFGIFTLRGKFRNVRSDLERGLVVANEMVEALIRAIGLKKGEVYDNEKSFKQLRYEKVMIATDQDHDGSHIKGLIINFFHTHWPSLLKRNPPFLSQFITPYLKVTCGHDVKRFYYESEFYEWHTHDRVIGNQLEDFVHYKGLSSHEMPDLVEYVHNREFHMKDFVWEDESDDKAIELAFSSDMTPDRKAWLLSKEKEFESFHGSNFKTIRFKDFIHEDLKLYSLFNLARSIPCISDGLKDPQRKALYIAFEKKSYKREKVEHFSGVVSSTTPYHHRIESLCKTIILMTHKFTGSNNINLFELCGLGGSRNQKGKDAPRPAYDEFKLSEITRSLFLEEDEELLDKTTKYGPVLEEPVCYKPVIPLVLANGAVGVGTGWSTNIPKFNPLDLFNNLKLLLDNKSVNEMHPWCKNFNGEISLEHRDEQGCRYYVIHGVIHEAKENVDSIKDDEYVTLSITELPFTISTECYIEHLRDMQSKKFIEEFTNRCLGDTILINVVLSKKNYNIAETKGLKKTFKLIGKLNTSNMNLFDVEYKKIVKYDTPEAILEAFYDMKWKHYRKRVEKDLKNYDDKDVRSLFLKDLNDCEKAYKKWASREEDKDTMEESITSGRTDSTTDVAREGGGEDRQEQ